MISTKKLRLRRPAMLLALLATACMIACSHKDDAAKSAVPAFTAQVLAPAEENRLIQMAQNLKTADGASVLQVLQHAEQMRPDEFKLRSFDVFYDSSGKPESIGACYWIGSKRLDDDRYCDISFKIAADRQSLAADFGNESQEIKDEMTITKVMSGRDGFLTFVDENYKSNCIGFDNKKSC